MEGKGQFVNEFVLDISLLMEVLSFKGYFPVYTFNQWLRGFHINNHGLRNP
jgi:hypothetical protein